jgi:anti-sigma B factor antagonist
VGVRVSTRQVGKVTVVDAPGRITSGEAATSFHEAIRAAAGSGQKKVLVNLAETSYMDSCGIGELVSGFTTLASQGGVLKLLKVTKRIQDLLQVTRLYSVFEVYDDEAKALASFQ